MPKTIIVTDTQVEASKPDWLRQHNPDHPLHELYAASLPWRAEIHAADNADQQDRIRQFAVEWDIARHTITLAEAERRWNKTNLRQNPINHPYRWQSEDGRGTWLTTTYTMEAAFGPEVKASVG